MDWYFRVFVMFDLIWSTRSGLLWALISSWDVWFRLTNMCGSYLSNWFYYGLICCVSVSKAFVSKLLAYPWCCLHCYIVLSLSKSETSHGSIQGENFNDCWSIFWELWEGNIYLYKNFIGSLSFYSAECDLFDKSLVVWTIVST